MRELECPLVASFDVNPDYSKGSVRNVILTTQEIDAEKADQFTPYEDLDGTEADKARERYVGLVGSEKPLG